MRHLEIIECKPLRQTVFRSLLTTGAISFGVGFVVGYLAAVAILYSMME